MKDNSVSKKVIIWIIIVSFLILLIVLFALFFAYNNQLNAKNKTYDNGSILMTYSSDNMISINNSLPMSDEVGMALNDINQYFDFTVNTTLGDSEEVLYEITALKDQNISNISDSDVRLYLEKQDRGTFTKVFGPSSYNPLSKKTKLNSPIDSMVLLKVNSTDSKSDNYRLRMWFSDEASLSEDQLKYFTIKVNVYGKAK